MRLAYFNEIVTVLVLQFTRDAGKLHCEGEELIKWLINVVSEAYN